MSYSAPGFPSGGPAAAATFGPAGAPLVVVFERDDGIAVPLLSQLRMAGYDVRAARTPVELHDHIQKHAVSLVLVDLGCAAAGRREFWVALHAQQRGRPMQLLTFRLVDAVQGLDADMDLPAQALADVEVRSSQDLEAIVAAVRQKVPLNGAIGAAGAPGISGAFPAGPLGLGPLGAGAPLGSMTPGGGPLGQPGDWQSAPGYPGNGAGNGFVLPMGIDPFQGPPSYAPDPARTPPMPPSTSRHYPPDIPTSQFVAPPPSPAFSPFDMPSGPSAPPASYPGAPGMGPGFGAPAPFQPDMSSPFAHPASQNPFDATGAQASPFDQPFVRNPFDATGGLPATRGNAANGNGHSNGHGNGPNGNGSGGFPLAPLAPLGPWMEGAGPASQPAGSAFDAHGSNGSAANGSAANGHNGQNGQNGGQPRPARAHVTDAWVPPGGDDIDTMHAPVPAQPGPTVWSPSVQLAVDRLDRPEPEESASGFPTYDIAQPHSKALAIDDPHLHDATAPISAQLPVVSGNLASQADRALGSVLVEGALLSAQKLEVLKGIQRMLASVDMDFKLGELALLFKFLSPDQLLAALLVSRGVVSPQQIAALGKIKQELGRSGMDYDLETLLVMFHILPAEELRALRKELA